MIYPSRSTKTLREISSRNSGVIFFSISLESVPLREYIIHHPPVRIIGSEIFLERREVFQDGHMKEKVITLASLSKARVISLGDVPLTEFRGS